MRPNVEESVRLHQEYKKLNHDKRAKYRKFEVENAVYACNIAPGEKWLLGRVTKALGPVSYTIALEDGRIVRKHVDQLRTKQNSTPKGKTLVSSQASKYDTLSS